MTRTEKDNWLCNLENTAGIVGEQIGWEIVSFVLQRYNVTCIEQLNPSDYQNVFSELYAIEADLRN